MKATVKDQPLRYKSINKQQQQKTQRIQIQKLHISQFIQYIIKVLSKVKNQHLCFALKHQTLQYSNR